MYVQGSLAAIERIMGVARISKMLPGVALVRRQRRSRDEHSKMRKRSTKPFARRKPFSDQRPPSKNAPRLYVVDAKPNLEWIFAKPGMIGDSEKYRTRPR